MHIDIDQLTEEELVELNHRIVARLKFLESMHSHKEMMKFNPGEQVSFEPPGRGKQVGTLVKYNKKTVTVITESGQTWNVSPHLLNKVKSVNQKNKNSGNVVDLPRKK
jgi:hypothetical protein